jgi:hypothetical protein
LIIIEKKNLSLQGDDGTEEKKLWFFYCYW